MGSDVCGKRGHALSGQVPRSSPVAWAWNGYGQCDVPEPGTDLVANAEGGARNLGIRGYPRGDLDHDRGLGRDGFALLPDCLLGPDARLPPECDDAAVDSDSDAGLAAFALFQTLLTGLR